MAFSTLNELVGNTRAKIDNLYFILDTLVMNYRNASEIIDRNTDPRKPYLTQLQELNDLIKDIVDNHPAMHVEKISNDVVKRMSELADSNLIKGSFNK